MLLKRKKLMVVMATIVTMSINYTTAFTGTSFYKSDEGIGIEVKNMPNVLMPRINVLRNAIRYNEIIDDSKVSVDGGDLWTTWKGTSYFRANYYHTSKIHRCSATNDHSVRVRSKWIPAGKTAVSPWLEQTFTNNRIWAATQ